MMRSAAEPQDGIFLGNTEPPVQLWGYGSSPRVDDLASLPKSRSIDLDLLVPRSSRDHASEVLTVVRWLLHGSDQRPLKPLAVRMNEMLAVVIGDQHRNATRALQLADRVGLLSSCQRGEIISPPMQYGPQI